MIPGDELLPSDKPVPAPEPQVPAAVPEGAPAEGQTAFSGEGPPPAPRPESADRARWVAVLIMVVTLLGALFAFVQNAASNRAAAAARRSDAAAVEAEAEAVRAAQRLGAQWRVWTLAAEELQVALALGWSEESGASALAAGYQAAAKATGALAGIDLEGDFGPVWQTLFEDTWAETARAGEFQKAYAAERSGWGAKGSQYVAVTTVLAVALFLLGLSRTSVGAHSGRLLVWSGLAVAGAASIWGLVVLARPVASPSPEAIDAYVEGQVALGSALTVEDLGKAEDAFTRALAARPGYADAYFGRGLARGQIALVGEGGPQGSAGARADFERVVALDSLNQVAWGNLAVARLRLGDPEGAVVAGRRAVDIQPDDPSANLHLAAFLLLSGDTGGYEVQLAVVRSLFGGGDVTDAMRAYLLNGTWQELEMAKAYLPDAAAAARGQEDLLRLDHQITVGREYFGTGLPAPVEAGVSPLGFTLSEDHTQLLVTFDATGVAADQRWLWRTYRAGVVEENLSPAPAPWPFAVPDGPGSISLTAPEGFAAGVTVRVEVFLEGNLLQAGEYTP